MVVMNDGEPEHAHNWLLAEENRVFFFTFSSLALAVASILLWRAQHVDNLPANDRPDSQSVHSPQSVLTAALSTFHLASRAPVECDMSSSQQQSTAESSTSSTAEQKPSRSKERRRRGKVPNKELLKGGKKAKVAPKLPTHQDNNHGDSLTPEMEHKSMANDNNIASPISRQPSPTFDGPEENMVFGLSSESPAAGECHEEHYSPASTIASLSEPAPVNDLQQNTVTSHHSMIGPSRSAHAHSIGTTDSTQPTESPCHHDDPAPSIPESSLSEDHDTHGQSPSTVLHASTSTHVSDSGRKSQAYMTSPRTKPPRFMSKQRGSDNSNGGHAVSTTISGNVLLALSTGSNHVSPRITPSTSTSSSSLHQSSESTIGVSSSRSGSPAKLNSSPTLPHVTFPTLNPLQASANDHTHTHSSIVENLNPNGKKPTTPQIQTASRCSTPSIGVSAHIGRTDSPVGPLSAQTQLASMRGALEAARLREEKARTEAECMAKENEELKWRWNEDVMAWRRRESEVSI